MMLKSAKAFLSLILFLPTHSLTSGTSKSNKYKQCPYIKDSDKEKVCFNIILEIEGLKYDDVCTKHKVDNLESALLEFHNANIDCACPGNHIEYSNIDIINVGIGEGNGGNLEWCERRNGGRLPYRKLSVSSEEIKFVDINSGESNDRNLYLDSEFASDFSDSIGVEYSVTATCGYGCPKSPCVGASGIETKQISFHQHFVTPEFRRLHGGNSGDDAACFEPLFIEIFEESGFEQVTGVNVVMVRKKRTGFCADAPPLPMSSYAKKGSKRGTKGSKDGKGSKQSKGY